LTSKGNAHVHADGKGRLLLVRHTQSVWNSLDLFTGWVDVDLSEKGKLDAKSVGVKIAGVYNVDIAFTSSLVRAQQTLQLVMDGAGIQGTPVTEDWHLNERFYGNWQGKNKTEMKAKYGEDAIQAVRRGYAQRPPAGESLEDTAERVLPYFTESIEPALAEGKTVLIAAHGNSLRALVKHLENMSDEAAPGIEIGNGELREYVREADGSYTRGATFHP
jgi:2,3-bisphosphoglycerate-dependent phosphoglycerate mutase